MRLRMIALPSVVSAALLAACGSDDAATPATSPAPASQAAAGDAAERFNGADVNFAQGMIAHHEQAIQMAEIAIDPKAGAGEKVLDLAKRIQAGQDPEITTLSELLSSWGKPTSMGANADHDMSSMHGMMSDADMDVLVAANGPEFDKMWMEMMIDHHSGAIEMSQAVKTDGSSPDLKTMADQIIAAQQGEIDEMQGLLGG